MNRANILDPKTVIVAIAAAALLALSGAGVSVAKAEPATSEVKAELISKEAAPTCSVEASAALDPGQVNAAVEAVRAHAEARAADPAQPEITVLNGRGANYDSGPTLDLSAFIELQRGAAAPR